MGTRDTYQRTLTRACLVAGDEAALARQLGVPVTSVVDWLLGDSEVPADVFLRAVDIVLTANRKQVEDNRAFLDQVRRRHRQ
jgi:DNA-binding transcriptional regulator YdaS (Cro superfamily)